MIVYKLLFILSLFSEAVIQSLLIYFVSPITVSTSTLITSLIQIALVLFFFFKIYVLSKNRLQQNNFICHQMKKNEFILWLILNCLTYLISYFSLGFNLSEHTLLLMITFTAIRIVLTVFTIRVLFLGTKLIAKP